MPATYRESSLSDPTMNNEAPTRGRRLEANYGDIGEGLLKPDENAWRPHHSVCLPPGGLTSVTVFGPFIGPVGSITGLPDAVDAQDRNSIRLRQSRLWRS
jgi:hypothetical protein